MAEITAAMVKELREQTQLPMMKCKKALQDSGGDLEAAKEALRKEGESFIDGRGDRTTEEGRMAIYTDVASGPGAIIELQVESAPVASNDEVVALGQRPGQAACHRTRCGDARRTVGARQPQPAGQEAEGSPRRNREQDSRSVPHAPHPADRRPLRRLRASRRQECGAAGG